MKNLKIIKREHQRTGYNALDIEPIEYTELVAQYDDNGSLVREERYDTDGEINTLTLNSYNENNLLVLTEQYDLDNILLQKTENLYDEDGKIVEQTNYYGDASDKFTTKYIYIDGLLARLEVYMNGKLDYIERTVTYKDGRIENEIENDDYGNAAYSNRYEYDSDGNVVKYTRDELQNKDRRTYEFTYDDHGNRVKDLVYDFEMKLIAKSTRIFDENNRIMEYVDEDLDNYRHVKTEYDGNLVKKNSIFDRNGNIVSYAEYEYDSDNKESKSTEYGRDEVNPEKLRIVRETFYERS